MKITDAQGMDLEVCVMTKVMTLFFQPKMMIFPTKNLKREPIKIEHLVRSNACGELNVRKPHVAAFSLALSLFGCCASTNWRH